MNINNIVFIIVGFFITTLLFPMTMTQIIQNNKSSTSSSTTTWNSGIFNIFITIMPILIIVGIGLRLFNNYEFGHNEYGDIGIERRWEGIRNYNGAEQTAFENEVIDMHNYFIKDK